MNSPKIEKAENILAIQPVYPAKEKLTSRSISKIMKTALDELGEIEETLDDEIMQNIALSLLIELSETFIFQTVQTIICRQEKD